MTDARRQDRELDLVLFGATGFTGRLTAEYLARHAPDGLRWGLAGRNPAKLEAVREHLADHRRRRLGDLPLLTADVTDDASLKDIANRARVVITTVGPYLQYGEPLVAACAEAGTDYVDLTGEPEFVDRMYVAHHATAQQTGARLVHACGFDSIPHDLGAYFTVQQLPDDVPITLRGVVRASGMFSGGTFHSAMNAFSRARQTRGVGRPPPGRAAPRGPQLAGGRRQAAPRPGARPLARCRCRPSTRSIVARSGAALAGVRPRVPLLPLRRHQDPAVRRRRRRRPSAALGARRPGAAAAARPARPDQAGRRPRRRAPGASRGSPSTSSARAAGRPSTPASPGGDPGYDETAKMLAESALCLAFDDNPPTAGQVTTAQAMGDHADRPAAGRRDEVRGALSASVRGP